MKVNKNNIKIIVHASIWLLLLISTINYVIIEYSIIDSIGFSLVYVFSISLIFYLNYFFLSDLIFIHKKYVPYLLTISMIIALLDFITTSPYFNDWFTSYTSYYIHLDSVINLVLLFGISNLLRGYEYWFDVREKQNELEKENIANELKFLKSQINPHFLFNTLNNIYSLAYHKDDNAPEMISKLSKLLRYMLYDCSENRVGLNKEIEMIRIYLDLEILRLGDERNIDFYFEGITGEHKIAPLILINVIENAFKHSDISSNKNGWIKIELFVNDNKLNYIVENTMRASLDKNSSSGIGIDNLKKQLEINYKNSSKIEITEKADQFKTEIQITLEENHEI